MNTGLGFPGYVNTGIFTPNDPSWNGSQNGFKNLVDEVVSGGITNVGVDIEVVLGNYLCRMLEVFEYCVPIVAVTLNEIDVLACDKIDFRAYGYYDLCVTVNCDCTAEAGTEDVHLGSKLVGLKRCGSVSGVVVLNAVYLCEAGKIRGDLRVVGVFGPLVKVTA